MNRRHLLQLSLALAGGSLLTVSGAESRAGEQLRKLFGNPDLLERIGHSCPDLLAMNEERLMSYAGLAGNPTRLRDIATAFGARRTDDFLHGRIRTIDGWILAESECALCSLITRSAG